MTLKTGKVEEEIPSNQTDALLDVVKQLQGDIKRLKSEQSQNQSGISPSELAKILATYNAESRRVENKDYRQGIREEDIPKDDYDEAGITFCAPFTGYVVTDDYRMGHRVILPYNKESIFFKYQGSRRFQTGKHQELMAFSTYTSRSKKEQDWLRRHTFFNTMFYESTRGAANFDVIKAQKIARIMTAISKFDLNQIVQRCKEYDIAISQDMDVMRTNLAFKMAERELDSERNATQVRLAEIEKEKALLMAGKK